MVKREGQMLKGSKAISGFSVENLPAPQDEKGVLRGKQAGMALNFPMVIDAMLTL